jgi:hypothetical protein
VSIPPPSVASSARFASPPPDGPNPITDEDVWREGMGELRDDWKRLWKRVGPFAADRSGVPRVD